MNIGLVLCGGFAKGAYQIGVLKALNELVPREDIKYISCASIGVLNGYAYATDNLDHVETIWKGLCTDETRIVVSQLLRSNMLQQNIGSIFDADKPLTAPFYASLFDLNSRNIVYKDLSTVKPRLIPAYLKASVAMPIYNRAVKICNTSYYDGGLVDNIPVFPLLQHNLDYIICVYFDNTCYQFENPYFDNKVIKITFPGENFVKQSLVLSQDGIERMIKVGYDQTRHLLQYVFADGYENLDAIYRAIQYLNGSRSGHLRITGDTIVTNLNKIVQKLAKRRVI